MRRLALLLAACGSTAPSPVAPLHNATPPPPPVTCAARCLPAVDFVDITGRPLQLAGKVVVVNFWATWAHPSLVEIPRLSRVYQGYRERGVVFVGVLTNEVDPADLARFQREVEIAYPIVQATPAILTAFGSPNAVPTTFVYDRTGTEVEHHVGALDEPTLVARLELIAQRR